MGSLNIKVLGESGPRIAFCHGLFGQGKNWTQIGKSLAQTGYQVALVDLPNHGKSAWTEKFSYPGMAQTLLDELDTLSGGEPWTLVGHSMGGKVVMLAALARPTIVERLVVVDMAPVDYGGLTTFGRYVEGMRALDLASVTTRADADAALVPYVEDQTVRAFLLQNLVRTDSGFAWQMNLQLLGDSLPLLSGWPSDELGSRIEPYEKPTLWIAGGESDYIRPEFVPAMRALFPKVRQVTIKGTGHWPHSEKPAVFEETLRAFLSATD